MSWARGLTFSDRVLKEMAIICIKAATRAYRQAAQVKLPLIMEWDIDVTAIIASRIQYIGIFFQSKIIIIAICILQRTFG